ncbi:MAG: hypothetical protein ACLFTB_05000 [Desulfovibrionales bacterium]
MKRSCTRIVMAFLILLVGATNGLTSVATSEKTGVEPEKEYALSLYAGRLTDDNWRQSLTGTADFVDSNLLTAALHWTFFRPENRWWSLELESNITKHFGDQEHWEFNAPILTGRWHLFPWSDFVATSAAFGMGLSFATEVPDVEKELSASSEQLMLYWHLEATLGPPGASWTTLFRLHHRSSGYGLFADSGGGNALAAGVRFFF